MRLHTLRHVPYEGLGNVGTWATAADWSITETRVWETAEFPEPHAFDLLVVLGGPMGVCDCPASPWMGAEMAYLERVIEASRPTLAICLGAQMIAAVLGAEVRRQPHPEIGWHRVEPTAAGRGSVLEPFFAPGTPVMQWHYDTFALPADACHLSRSAACENQAFSFGERVLALQFHPEMTQPEVATVVQRDGPLPTGPHCQTAGEILAPERFAALQCATGDFMQRLSNRWGLDQGDESA